jgi:hypothetical protein
MMPGKILCSGRPSDPPTTVPRAGLPPGDENSPVPRRGDRARYVDGVNGEVAIWLVLWASLGEPSTVPAALERSSVCVTRLGVG